MDDLNPEVRQAIDDFMESIESFFWLKMRRDKDPNYGGNSIDHARSSCIESLENLLRAWERKGPL